MKRVETIPPTQLRLGEIVVKTERNLTTGVIGKYEFVLVPTQKGPHCPAKLMQEANVIKMEGWKVEGLSAFKTTHDVIVGKHIGEWVFWNLPPRSTIGAYSKQLKKERVEHLEHEIKRVPALS